MNTHQNHLCALLFLISVSLLVCLSHSSETSYSIISDDENEVVTEERVVEMFEIWKEKHRKVYGKSEEAEKRLLNFKKNLKYVIEMKKKGKGGHRVGLNKFADLSNEEFRERYLRKVKKPVGKVTRGGFGRRKLESCETPSSLDWRKKGVVTAVKDQGDCGNFGFYFLKFLFGRFE